jgi:vacuolar-type H+-ATPase subunit I/STV1
MADEETQIENFDDVVKSMLVPADPNTGEPLPEPKKVTNGQAKTEEIPVESRDAKEAPRESTEGPDKAPEEEAEVEEPVDEDVDIDEIPLEVMVDGKLQNVTIKELKDKYSFVGAIDKRLQEVTEGRAVIQRQSNELDQVFQHSLGRLQALDNVLAQIEAPRVDMDELRAKDPTRYLFEKERMREASDRRNQVRAEAQRLSQQQEDIRNAALVEYSKQEAYILGQKDAEFADPVKAPQAMKRLSEGAKEYGYSPQEVYSVTDHRALLVLKDALEMRALRAQQKNGVKEAQIAPRPLMKPGTKRPAARSQQQKQMDALRAKAKETGRVEDVAATLIVRGRQK